VARNISSELRLTDVVARRGGDEFVALLPETSGEGAMEVAARIRDAIAAAGGRVVPGRAVVTVSIGIASFPQDGQALDALIGRADRALYTAKEGGRDRATRFQV